MRWSKPIGGLGALLVLLAALGAVATLALEPLGLGGGPFDARLGAVATVALVVVLVLVAILLGTGPNRKRSTPYW